MSKIEFINKENLQWARQRSGFDFPHIYKKAAWSPDTEKIQKWESGEGFPTISELRKLGEVYKRPWVLFILKENVNRLGFKPLEFRKIFGVGQAMTLAPPALFEFLNELKNRQDFLIEFAADLDLEDNSLVGSCQGVNDKKTVARKIISHTGIDMATFREKQTRREGFNYLVECLERKNIFVSLTGFHHRKDIPLEQMRGVLLNSDVAPIIGINAKNESYGAKIFTIFHELVHLFRGDSFNGGAEITKINFRNKVDAKNDKESFCDSVAAFILVPDDELRNIDGPIGKELIEQECKRLKVNHQPLLYRMQDFGLLDRKEVGELLRKLKEDKIDSLKKSQDEGKEGGPDGGFLKMLQNGRAFVHAVNAVYSQGRITFTQALNVLGVKAKTYKKFAASI